MTGNMSYNYVRMVKILIALDERNRILKTTPYGAHL